MTAAILLSGQVSSAWAQEDETDQDERMPVQASPMKLPISASQAVQNKILIPEATMRKTQRLQLPQDISIDTFNNCPPEGSAKTPAKAESNKEKNQWAIPNDMDIDTKVTLTDVLAPGDDHDRFKVGTAVRIQGYFSEVFKSGGSHGESCNCNATDDVNTDTHINMALTNSAENVKPENRMIVEVTPRLRYIAGLNGLDWSHGNLKHYEGSCLEIEGDLFWDDAHQGEARNTPIAGKNIWRATLWEVHPITSIQEIDCNKLF
ncbi:hypothetical protein DPM33_05020 [Mesorhizobium hawassense]|uniref:Uncharacterized protein n=2 Tax=Mesorhizobium hawassense TaxID=1209954 RepID=A0A330HUG1_9HYPH|nr:hypothetical protein DPM33_05020 [Mesorhizobium hawassense]